MGGTFSYTKNEIKEQFEAPKLYQNLVTTGLPYKQLFGFEAIGLFKDQADIDNSYPQTLGGVVRPGDIKYKDINGDKKIDKNDMKAIGYNTACPEIYYTINLGAEWKGLGFTAMLQGVGNYSAMLNTAGFYQPLMGVTSLSQYYYDNRWTPNNLDAKFPRLSYESNANNYVASTWWMKDASFLKLRNVEVYYNFPKKLLSSLKVVDNAKIYVRGTDLLCFDGIDEADPESYGATNPLTRSVVFGLQIGF